MSKILKISGIIVCVLAVILIVMNFQTPHTNTVERTISTPYQVNVPHEEQIASTKDFTLESNHYRYYQNIPITSGQTFKITWSADNTITGYIMSQNQFDEWNKNKNNLFNTINYLSTGFGNTKNVTYDVKGTGSYVAMLKNSGGFAGVGSSTYVYDFSLTKVTYNEETHYNTETQTTTETDNLYLIFGGILLVVGIVIVLVGSINRNNSQSPVNTGQVNTNRGYQARTKYCLHCGTQLPANSKYCNKCGQSVN